MNELIPQAKLVDSETGEIIGYMLQAGVRRVALTLDRIKNLNLDCTSYISFLEMETIEVLSYNNKFALVDNRLFTNEEYESFPYKVVGDIVYIWGSAFKQSQLITLDNDTAIKYAVYMKDEESMIINI